jgi:hypothetical protein
MDHRPLYEIARDIRADYAAKGKPVYYAAKPYVDAMAQLTSINENYFADSAESVILYALSNLSTWRGEKAREVKAELKAILK